MKKNKVSNIFEKAALQLGRIQAFYQQGKGVNAPLAEPSAWGGGSAWGEGVGRGRKPQSKSEMLAEFTAQVFICAKLNADTIASVPLRLYVEKKTKGQKFKTIETVPVSKADFKRLASNRALKRRITKAAEIEEVIEHPFLDVLHNVNPFMNYSDLMELWSYFIDLTGEAYWYLVKGRRLGDIREIWPIPSQYVRPIRGETLSEWITGWKYERGNQQAELSTDEVIDFRFPSPIDQYGGHSIVKGVADAIFVYKKMYEFEEALFANKARTGGLLESSIDISQAEVNRLRTEWDQKYAGASQAGRTGILPPGIKFVKDTMTPEELSFPVGKRITREEIHMGFSQPPALWDKTAIRANVEAALYFHAKFGILPRLRKLEEKLNEQLLPQFDEKLFCAFDDVVPEDAEFEHKARKENVEAGIISRDEAREEIGKDARGGPADSLYLPFNYVALGEGGGQAEEMAERLYRRALEKVKERLEG